MFILRENLSKLNSSFKKYSYDNTKKKQTKFYFVVVVINMILKNDKLHKTNYVIKQKTKIKKKRGKQLRLRKISSLFCLKTIIVYKKITKTT